MRNETYKNFYIKTDVFYSYTEYKLTNLQLNRDLSSVLERIRTQAGLTKNVRHNQDALLFLGSILYIGFRLQYYISVALKNKIISRKNGSPVKIEKCINIKEYKDSNNICGKYIDKLNELRGKTQSQLRKSLITRLVYFLQVITPALSLFGLDIIYIFREPLFYHQNHFIHGEDRRY